MFSIRIVTTSHYQAIPIPGLDVTHSDFRDGKVARVPVLRIFGSTPAGQKTCMHVHGVFPYLYVPYDGTAPLDRYLRQFSASLDKAINIGNRIPNSNLQHVFKISLVSGIPMYGYHNQEEPFLKIYLYNPSNIRKAADLLLGGAVMNKPFQPHESHVPFPLQLFMDYNLYGMNLINVGAVKFRKDTNENEAKDKEEDEDGSPPPSSSFLSAPTQIAPDASFSSPSSSSSNRIWSKDSIPSQFWHPAKVEKQSTCELEVDVIAADIINKQELMNNVGNNPGLAALWEDERQRRREAGLSSQILPDDSHEREGVELSSSEKELLEKFVDIIKNQQDAGDESQSTNEMDQSQSSIAASQLERHLSREDSITSSQATVILGDIEEEEKEGKDDNDDIDSPPIVSLDSINKVVASSQSFHIQEQEKSFTDSQDMTVAGILAAILEEDVADPSTSQQVTALENQDSILNATVMLDQEEVEREEKEAMLMSQVVTIDTGQQDKESPDLEDISSESESPDIVMNTDDEDNEEDGDDDDDFDDIDLLPVPQFDGASDKITSHTPSQQQTSVSDNPSTLDVNSSADQQQNLQYPSGNPQQRGRQNSQYNYTADGNWHSQQQQQQWQSPTGWQGKSPAWGTQQPQPQQMHAYSSWQQQQQQGTQQQPYTSPLQQQPSNPGTVSPFHSPPHNPYASPPSSHHHPGIHQPRSGGGGGGACNDFQLSSAPSSSQSPQSLSTHHSPHFSSSQPEQGKADSSSSPYHSMAYPYHSKPQGYSPYSPSMASQSLHNSSGGGVTDAFQSPTSDHPYKSPPTNQMYPPSSPAAVPPSFNQSYNTQHTSADPMSPPPPHSSMGSQSPYQHRTHSAASTVKNYPQHSPSGFNYRSPHGHQGFRTPPVCQGNSPVYPQSPLYPQSMPHMSSPQNPRYSSPSHAPSWGGSPSSYPYNSGYFSPTQSSPPHNSKVPQDPLGLNHPNVPCCSSDSIARGRMGSLNPAIATTAKGGKKLSSKEEQRNNKKQSDNRKGGVPTAQNPGYARAVAPPKGLTPASTPASLLEKDKETLMGHPSSISGSPSASTSETQQQPIQNTLNNLAENQKDCTNKDVECQVSSSKAWEENPNIPDPCTTPMIQQLLMEESPAKVNITPTTITEDKGNSMKLTTTAMASSPGTGKGKKKSTKNKGTKQGMRQRSASLTSSPINLPGHVASGPMFRPQGTSNMAHMYGGGRPMSHRPPHHSTPPFSPMGYGSYPPRNPEHMNSTMQQHYSPVSQWQQQQHQWGGQQWQKRDYTSNNLDMMHHASASDTDNSGNRLQQRSYSADCSPLPYAYSSPNNSYGAGQLESPQASLSSIGSNQAIVNETFVDNSNPAAEEKDGTLSSLLGLMSEDGLWGDVDATPNLGTNIGLQQQQQQQEGASTDTQQQMMAATPLKSSSSSSKGVNEEKSPESKEFITLEPAGRSSRSSIDMSGMTSSEESDRMDYEIATGLMLSKTPGGLNTPLGYNSHPPKAGKQSKAKTVDMLCRDIVHNGDGAAGGNQNPTYTYTFHVPTRLFKRLKFYRSAQARKKHNLRVLRMHPMDARKYSLLKIGKEVVNVVRLSENDLAKYNVTLPPPNLSPSDGSVSRVNLDIPLASSGASGYGSDDGHSSLSSYDTDFPPNKVAPPSSLPSSQALSPRSLASRPLPTTPPSAPSVSNANSAMLWPRQQYQMVSPSAYQQAGPSSAGSISGCSTSLSTSNGNNYCTPHMSGGGVQNNGYIPHPYQQRMNQYGTSQTIGSPSHYSPYRNNSMMPAYNGGQTPNSISSTSFPQGTQYSSPHQYSINSGPHQPYNYNPSGFFLYNQQQSIPQDRQRMENGMHSSNTYPTTSAPTAPNQKNGLRSPGQHGPLTHTIDTDRLSDVSGGGDNEDDDNTTPTSATTTTTTACLVNTRAKAQSRRVHAQGILSSALENNNKGDGNTNSSSKLSLLTNSVRLGYSLCEKDRDDWSEPAPSQRQVDERINTRKIKHRKSRRKRNRRSSLRKFPSKSLENSCEETEADAVIKADMSKLESAYPTQCSEEIDGTFDQKEGRENQTNEEKMESTEHAIALKNQNCPNVGRKKKNKNWKSLRLTIPKQSFSAAANQLPSSIALGDEASTSLHNREKEMEGGESLRAEVKQHETPNSRLEDEQLCTRQSMRQAKMRSVKQADSGDVENKSKSGSKRHSRKEGVHYIIVNKFKGHQKMMVKIPKVPVLVGDVVDANYFARLAQRDVVRSDSVVSESDVDLNVVNNHHPVQIIVENGDNDNTKTVKINEENTVFEYNQDDSFFLQVDPPESAATSPETPFFCRLKKTFIKRQGGKGWINVSQRTKRKNNVFFPGVMQRLFVRFQATFQDNIAKQEDVQDYSSSSDDEDDYLDDVILRGKIQHAKELGIKKGLIMDRLNQSETFSLADIPSKIPPPEDDIAQNMNPDADTEGNPKYTPDTCSQFDQNAKVEPLHFSPITPAENFTSPYDVPFIRELKAENRDGVTLGSNVGDGLPLQNSNLVGAVKESVVLDHKRLDCGLSTDPEPIPHLPNNNHHAQTVCSNNTKESVEDRSEFIKRQMAFYEDISSDPDSDDTIIENSSSKLHVDNSCRPVIEKDKSIIENGALTTEIGINENKKLDMENMLSNENIALTIENKFTNESIPLSENIKENSELIVEKESSENGKLITQNQPTIGNRELVVQNESRKENTKSNNEISSSDIEKSSPIFENNTVPEVQSLSHTDNHIKAPNDRTNELDLQVQEKGEEKTRNNQETRSDTECNTAIKMFELKSENTNEMYHLENENTDSLSTLVSESNGADKAKVAVVDQECSQENHQEMPKFSNEKSSDGTVRINISELGAASSHVKKSPENITYNDLMSLKIDTRKGRKGAKSRQKLHCKTIDSSFKAGISKRKKRKEAESLTGLATSSNDERGSSPFPPPSTKRLRQRKQTKYTYHMDGIDSSSSSSDEANLLDYDTFQSKQSGKFIVAKGNGSIGRVGSQVTTKPSNQRPARGRRKKGAGSSNKLLNSLSLLHMATLANLTESQDSPVSPGGPDQAASIGNGVTPYSNRAVSDHSQDYTSSLETMSFTTPPDEADAETSPPMAISPAEKMTRIKNKHQQGKETKTSSISNSCRNLNFSSCHNNRVKPGCNGSSNTGTRPLFMNHLVATNSASSSPVPANFFNQSVADTTDQQANSSTNNVKSELDKIDGTIPFSMKQILRMSMTDDSMDSDSKDGPALIKPRESKRAQVKSTTLSMSDIMKMTTSTNSVDYEEHIEGSFTILADKKELNPSTSGGGGCIAEVKDVALSFKDIMKMTKAQEEREGSEDESVSSIPKALSASHLNHEEPDFSQSKDLIEEIKNASFDRVESSFVKSTPSSSDISLNNEHNATSKSELLAEILPKEIDDKLDIVTISVEEKPAVDECNEEETSEPESQQKLDTTDGDYRKENLMKMKDGSLLKCLSPLSCIIEESQISRRSQDEFTSGEPDNGVTPAGVNDSNAHLKGPSSDFPSISSSMVPNNDIGKHLSQGAIEDKDTSPDVIESSQENVKRTLAIPLVKRTLAESAVKHNGSITELTINTDPPPVSKRILQQDNASCHTLHIPPVHQLPTNVISPSSLSSKSYSGPSPHHSYPWCWKWQEQPQRVRELQNCPLNLSTSNLVNKSTTAVYSPITPTSPISPYPLAPPLSSPCYNSTSPRNNEANIQSPPIKKSKPLWYPWLSSEKTSSIVHHSTSAVVKDPSLLRATALSKENRTDGFGQKHKTDFTHVKDTKPQRSPRLSECSSISQFVGSVIETAYDMGSNLETKTKTEVKKKWNERTISDCDVPFSKYFAQPTGHERIPKSEKSLDMHKESYKSIDKSSVFRNGLPIPPPSWCDQSQTMGQHQIMNYTLSSHSTVHAFSKPETTSTQSNNRKREDGERVRNMLENERALRGQFGLASNAPSSNQSGKQNTSSGSPSPASSGHMSLTDILVTQMIKGEGSNAYPAKETAASTSKKRGQSNRQGKSADKKDGGSTGSSKGAGTDGGKGQRGEDSIKRSGGGGDRSGERLALGIPSSISNDKRIVIRPEKRAPTRLSIESSLMQCGFNSIQVPSAFCSSVQDLPERPLISIERRITISPTPALYSLYQLLGSRIVIHFHTAKGDAGGRVLNVASKRLSELKEFEGASFLEGIQMVRATSLASSNLLSSQAPTTGGHLDRILEKQGPAIRFLFGPDKPVVIAPCRLPPKRKLVAQWLQTKVLEVMKGKENVQLVLGGSQNKKEPQKEVGDKGNVTATPKTRRKSVLFTQLPAGRDSDDSPSPPSSPGYEFEDTQFDDSLSLSSSLSQTPGATTQMSSGNDRHSRKRKNELSLAQTSTTSQIQPTKMVMMEGKMAIPTVRQSSTTPTTSSHETVDESRELNDGNEALHHNVSTQLLKRISTNTESALRRNVLMAQPQRQFSEMGFTAAEVSQIEGPTPNNSFGFKVSLDNMQEAKAVHKHQYVTAMSLELHVETRGDLRPNPEHDAVKAVFFSIFDDIPPEQTGRSRNLTGIVMVDMDSWHVITDRQKTKSSQSQTDSGSNQQPSTSSSSSSQQRVSHTPKVSASQIRSLSPIPSTSKKGASPNSPSLSKSPKGKGRGKKKGTAAASPNAPKRPNAAIRTLLECCAINSDMEIIYVQDETDLMMTIVDLIHRFDPDILVGFEIQMLSWGYLLQRAAQLNIELCSKIARIPGAKENNFFTSDKDQWGADHMSEIHVVGRIVLNLWRILRHEVSLNTYTFENCVYHILHHRMPLFSFKDLTKWFAQDKQRWRVVDHYVRRVESQLKMIDQLDLIGKTSEFARVFGIEFYDVLSRGSQIRVESLMLRLAKPMNYVAVSPNIQQRARQKAIECIALTLEPESKYYTSPVVVLDFQSLYPSIMIAYNYCFSTCLGRLESLKDSNDGPIEFGCTSLPIPAKLLKSLKSKVTISPNGVVFVKSSVRRGIISKMVEEILNTRIMVKKSMKDCKDDKTLSRMLDARQLGLKLIANVTYGYAGASFSGRMPCVEVADSIVRKARESLERAIKLVEDTPRWGARVVYGDTDSMFIHFPGRSKDEAFVLGHEIADAVTAMFPNPMKLKFEKVYLPCALETKKRYVGFMYETPEQKEPVFDAKGIETVRRDSCSAVSKILERSVKIMFSTHDLSRVRSYVCRQLHKLLEGKVSLLDLVFAKEFRGMMGYKPGACVPSLEIARKRLKSDPCSEPRVGERVPYVIIHGSPGLPLIQLVREPQELIKDRTLRLNAVYYITKQILPPLDRLFSLIGVNVFKWYREMPKVVRVGNMIGMDVNTKQGTISQFFATSNCPVCDTQTKTPICKECRKDPQLVVTSLNTKIGEWEDTFSRLAQVCTKCQGIQDEDQPCISVDCPILYRRHVSKQDMHRADTYNQVLKKFLLDF